MKSCVYCKRRYKKNSETSFHKFPKDLEERKVWLQNMKTTNWSPKPYHSLCSLHFNDECFAKHFNRTTLKPYSIPTIFKGTPAFPSSPRSSTTSLRPSISTSSPHPSKSTSLPNPSTTNTANNIAVTDSAKNKIVQKLFCDANIAELSNKIKRERDQEELNNHDYEVASTLKKARLEFGLLHDHCYENTLKSSKQVAQQARSLKCSKAKLKTLSQHVRRLKLKVASLKSVINDLTKKK